MDVVRAVAVEAWRDPDGRAGVRDAARQAGWVLRHRRRLPAAVEAALTTLSRPQPNAAVPAPAGAGAPA
ncbi:hypothetical protein [Micromonospora sp. R77]|uniref:hypothetical protein n=1 Tax=Micromonospora sp. R77 TaxID=2925836 RepID=UPI0027E07594|nr:hypothetical protein [Micromonospora sp. R77]